MGRAYRNGMKNKLYIWISLWSSTSDRIQFHHGPIRIVSDFQIKMCYLRLHVYHLWDKKGAAVKKRNQPNKMDKLDRIIILYELSADNG